MGASSWSTQQLAEFIAGVSPPDRGGGRPGGGRARGRGARRGSGGDRGRRRAPRGRGLPGQAPSPSTELEADTARCRGLLAGGARCRLVRGRGGQPRVSARRDAGSRAAGRGLTRQETGLLRGMARVAAMTMTMLSVLDDERAAREEIERLAREQAALRRVATLVARRRSARRGVRRRRRGGRERRCPPQTLAMGPYDPDRGVEIVGGWSRAGERVLVGRRSVLGGQNVSTLVFERNGPAPSRDHLIEGADGRHRGSRVRSACARRPARRSASEGRLWGVMIVASTRENGLPAGHGAPAGRVHRADSDHDREHPGAPGSDAPSPSEQAALRRVATLVARGEPPRGGVRGGRAGGRPAASRRPHAHRPLRGRRGDGRRRLEPQRRPRPDPRPRVSLGGRNVTQVVSDRAARADRQLREDASGGVAADARAACASAHRSARRSASRAGCGAS